MNKIENSQEILDLVQRYQRARNKNKKGRLMADILEYFRRYARRIYNKKIFPTFNSAVPLDFDDLWQTVQLRFWEHDYIGNWRPNGRSAHGYIADHISFAISSYIRGFQHSRELTKREKAESRTKKRVVRFYPDAQNLSLFDVVKIDENGCGLTLLDTVPVLDHEIENIENFVNRDDIETKKALLELIMKQEEVSARDQEMFRMAAFSPQHIKLKDIAEKYELSNEGVRRAIQKVVKIFEQSL